MQGHMPGNVPRSWPNWYQRMKENGWVMLMATGSEQTKCCRRLAWVVVTVATGKTTSRIRPRTASVF